MNKNFRIAAWGIAACMLSIAGVAQTPNAPSAAQTPPAAAAPAPPANPFPPANPKFFTATSPTVDTVNAFLTQLWGYDVNRIWSVGAILSTKAPGVSKVVILVGDKSQPGKTQQTIFFTTPDGNHAIADNVIDFGAKPFAETRKVLMERVDGPARGVAGKELLIVEFSDLQCPHCKDAEPIMNQIATDFPQARVVFQNFPLVDIHPQAFQAAAVGLCVRKAKGDESFFKYVQAVFDAQSGLTPGDATATLDSAVTKAGGDPAAVMACAKTQPVVDALKASIQLAKDVGVDSTPTLYINGQPLPIGNVPYEVLKKIIVFRANQDGVPVRSQPSLKTLK
ncbi:MAG: thioredoxin domain-containing protein [Acidobacteriaceae bacterium]